MENASKALIIAGAILLSILIIALGIYIYNQAKSAINTNTLDATTLSTFNSPIEQYEGDAVLGSSLRSLMGTLITNAGTNEGAAEYLPSVTLNNGTAGTNASATGGETAANNGQTYINELQVIRSNLINSRNYVVELGYNDSGLVSSITIKYSEDTTT